MKVVTNPGDPGLFNLQIDGVTRATNVGNGGTTGAVVVSPGTHSVAETAGAGTDLANYTVVVGGDCNPGGNVSLAAGDIRTCTITNTGLLPPRLTVNKVLSPSDDAGRFNLLIDGANRAGNVGGGGTTGPVVVSVGAHSVGETAGSGTNAADYDTIIGGDCAADGSVTLAPGDNKTCTITNTLKLRAQCLRDCVADRDACLAEVGKPGGPLPSQCVNAYVQCQRRCPPQ